MRAIFQRSLRSSMMVLDAPKAVPLALAITF